MNQGVAGTLICQLLFHLKEQQDCHNRTDADAPLIVDVVFFGHKLNQYGST